MAKRESRSKAHPAPTPPTLTQAKQSVEQLRAESIDNIKAMSKSHPLTRIDIKQQNSIDGTPEGILDVDSRLCHHRRWWDRSRFHTWLAEEVRPLWERSVPYIPKATILEDYPDGGFIYWLWSRSQKIWNTFNVRATVADPYDVWVTAITDSQSHRFNPVAANPNEATPDEILRVAEFTKGVGHSRVRIYSFFKRISKAVEETQKEVNSMEYRITAGETMLKLQASGIREDVIAVNLELPVQIVSSYLKRQGLLPLSLQDAKHNMSEGMTKLIPLQEELHRTSISFIEANNSDSLINCYFQELCPSFERERNDRHPSRLDCFDAGSLWERYYHWMGDQLRLCANTWGETDTKANWVKRFGISESTLRNRQRGFPDAFCGEKTSKSCQIRSDYVEKWTKKQVDSSN